jgi:hypothetical protein
MTDSNKEVNKDRFVKVVQSEQNEGTKSSIYNVVQASPGKHRDKPKTENFYSSCNDYQLSLLKDKFNNSLQPGDEKKGKKNRRRGKKEKGKKKGSEPVRAQTPITNRSVDYVRADLSNVFHLILYAVLHLKKKHKMINRCKFIHSLMTQENSGPYCVNSEVRTALVSNQLSEECWEALIDLLYECSYLKKVGNTLEPAQKFRELFTAEHRLSLSLKEAEDISRIKEIGTDYSHQSDTFSPPEDHDHLYNELLMRTKEEETAAKYQQQNQASGQVGHNAESRGRIKAGIRST